MEKPEHDQEEDDLLIACSLRFQGYEFAEALYGENSNEFMEIYEAHVRNQTIPEDRYEALGVFFMLQRYLFKWGGERLTGESPEWVLFRRLFLRACEMDVPDQFRNEEHCRIWEDRYARRIEEHKRLVQERLDGIIDHKAT